MSSWPNHLQSPGVLSHTQVREPQSAMRCQEQPPVQGLWNPHSAMEAMNQSGQPRKSGKRRPMWPAPLTSGGLALEEVTCRGWDPHLQYSFLINIFFEPCVNATGSSTGTCQHPTLQKHTDKHRITNIKQNFKSPSTTSQPPPRMGLIYIKKRE